MTPPCGGTFRFGNLPASAVPSELTMVLLTLSRSLSLSLSTVEVREACTAAFSRAFLRPDEVHDTRHRIVCLYTNGPEVVPLVKAREALTNGKCSFVAGASPCP